MTSLDPVSRLPCHDLGASYASRKPVHTYDNRNAWNKISPLLFPGTSIVLVYTIAVFCLKKISRNRIAPPSLPIITLGITLPIVLYNIAYIIAGWGIHKHSSPNFCDPYQDVLRNLLQDGRVAKRVSVLANGYLVDTMVVCSEKNLGNGRFVIYSNANNQLYEGSSDMILNLADKLEATAVLYNYASTGRSSGRLPNREAMVASHQSMHSFVATLGAKEIVDIGLSIGCGVQGVSLKHYQLNKDVRYVFVKIQPFADLSMLVGEILSRPLGFALWLLKWNYSSIDSSRALEHHEIIIQTGILENNNNSYEEIKESSKVIGDGVISKQGALATVLLDDSTCSKENKTFLIINELHGHFPKNLAGPINEQLLKLNKAAVAIAGAAEE
ncbi:MAG: hypothetical protein K1060chlam2_01084 [Chlamydiae bacterium]|nr:hypothetical protein [Chlamydiota bacterium]